MLRNTAIESEPPDPEQLKEVLRRQSALLEQVQRIGQIGGWELNRRTQKLTWTDETYRIHGVTRADYSPMLDSAIAFYTPQSRPFIRRALEAASMRAVRYDLELQILRENGVRRWVRATGGRADQEGEPDVVRGVFQDITERRLLEQEIVNIAQRERALIGFDLHDGLGQELTGVSLILAGILSNIPDGARPFRDELRQVEISVRAAIDTCRALAQGVSPTGRERGGLVGAVRELAVQIEKLHCLEVSVRTRGCWDIDNATADHLYRITQEAVTNAIKHAHARRIVISLASNAARSLVSIVNDHRGISENTTDGMGLKIMRYRAHLMGATLSITDLPFGGLRVRCCVPNEPTPLTDLRPTKASRRR